MNSCRRIHRRCRAARRSRVRRHLFGQAGRPLRPAAKIIGKDISWDCGADACRGSTEASRPLVLCQDLAKRAGRLESFAADGRALTADQLDKCNAVGQGRRVRTRLQRPINLPEPRRTRVAPDGPVRDPRGPAHFFSRLRR